jgi:peptide/nickel transport system permease protein
MNRKAGIIGLMLLAAAALLVVSFSASSYSQQDRMAIMAPSSSVHWAGTDALGRDRAVRVSLALLLGLFGAAGAAILTTAMAATVGMLAAFTPRPVGALMMFISDAFLSIPWIFLLMMVRSFLPLTASPLLSAATTFLVLAALGWPAAARVIYQGSLHLKSSEWILHGRAAGLRTRQLLRLHVLPNLRALLLPQFFVCIPAFIIAEANLGSLGLGIAEPLPSWGSMLLELQNSALLAESRWLYLPIGMLVLVLLLLESSSTQVHYDA